MSDFALQHLIFPASSNLSEKEMYFRSEKAEPDQFGSLLIPPYAAVRFDTHFNLFALSKWFELTSIDNLKFVAESIGLGFVELYGIYQAGELRFERVLARQELLSDAELALEVPVHDGAQAVYARFVSHSGPLRIIKAAFITQGNPSYIDLALCMCTYNREKYLHRNIEVLRSYLKKSELPVRLIVANNGAPLLWSVGEEVVVLQNRNLGGAGGFARAALEAQRSSATHVVFMDDDIELEPEAVLRTVRLLQFLKPIFSDHFLSGCMVSACEKWLQYERNASFDEKGFVHYGHNLDLRRLDHSLDNATAPAIRGIAGWWYCVIPMMCIRDYGLPLPIFLRGDDIEYSIRCDRSIISLNGIQVWHEPFWLKFSEVMEFYYLSRNMLMVSYLYPDRLRSLYNSFFVEKFWSRLSTYDYVSANLILLAASDLLNKRYLLDSAELAIDVQRYSKGLKDGIVVLLGGDRPGPKWLGRKTCILRFIRRLIRPSNGGVGHALAGFERQAAHFAGKTKVFVYDPVLNQTTISHFDRRESVKLMLRFFRLRLQLWRRRRDLRRDLLSFRRQTTSVGAWEDCFQTKL